MREIVLAADLGGTNLRMAAIDTNGEILYRTKSDTPRGEGPLKIADAIVSLANECRRFCPELKAKMIAVAIPGTVKEGLVMTAPNLPAINGFSLAAEIERQFGIQTILENDANAAAVGESWLGASREFSNSICLTLGTGIGGGIVIDGKVLRGVNGAAGELGHICVEANGVQCGCGSRGCIEQYASASAIVRLAKKLQAEYPGSLLPNDLQASEIFEAAKANDPLALEVFRLMGLYLGVALSDLMNIFDPGVIVVCGGASAGWELFTGPMQETIEKRAFGNADRAPVIRGILGDDAGILGAARIAFDAPK